MRKKSLYYFFSLILVATLAFGFIQLNEDPNADVAPQTDQFNYPVQSDTIKPPTFPYATLFNFNYSAIGGMNGGTVGAMFLNGKYYFNRWNSTLTYRYNNNGPGGGPGTVADSLTYVGSCRDLTTDGTFLYGGPASTTLYRFNPDNMATLKTFVLSGGATRAMAWDPNRKGFWNTNFGGNIFLHDTNGVLKQTITSALTGKYGMGFDSTSSPDSAFLWVWNQGTGSTTNELHKIHIQSGVTKATYIFTLTGASVGIAGGFEVVANAIPNKLVALANYQNQALVGYNFKDLSSSQPRTWTEQTSGITGALYSISAVDNNVAWACGAAGAVLRTTNKGVTWTNVTGSPIPTSLALYNIYGVDANIALVTGSSSTGTFVYRTSNGGSTWTQVFTQTGGFMNAILMSSSTNGYMTGDPVGGRWSLFKTVNGGVTWDSAGLYVAEPTSAGWNNSFFNLGNSWWFGTNSTNIKYSANNGTSWGNQVTPAANQYAVWFNSATVGLSGGAQLYVTTDGGTTWANLTSIGSGNISGIVGSGSEWWFTRQATAVNYSSDNGANWTAQYTAPAGSFYHLAYSRSGNTIWGVRSNGGISRYGEPITGITPVTSQVPSDYALGQNYPNPFNPVTNINFAIPKSGLVTMKVYDIIGREVATLVNEVKTAGSYVVDFDASRLSSGVYFYRIEVNGFKDVKRMTLIK